MRGRHPVLAGWALGLVGVAVCVVVLGRLFPEATVPLPGIVPAKLRQSALVDKALLAGMIGPGAGSLYAGYAGADGPLRGAARGYAVSLASIWLAGTALPAGFFVAVGISALAAARPTLVAVYAGYLLVVLVGGLALAAVLAVPGGLWGALGVTIRRARADATFTWSWRP